MDASTALWHLPTPPPTPPVQGKEAGLLNPTSVNRWGWAAPRREGDASTQGCSAAEGGCPGRVTGMWVTAMPVASVINSQDENVLENTRY